MFDVKVDQEKCTGAGECVNVCPVEVFVIKDGKSVPVNADECIACMSCVDACPQGAIEVNE